MSSLAYILREAGLVIAGAVACYLLLWWKNRSLREALARENEAIREKARLEAENLLQEARLAASAEALKMRTELEESFTARRAERAESERRLAERENLINSQLQRLVENESALKERKEQLARRGDVLDGMEQDVENRLRQAREILEQSAGLSATQARETLLKRVLSVGS